MTDRTSTLTEESRQNLLSRVLLLQRRALSVVDAPESLFGSPTDFRTLPGYDQLRLEQAFAERSGIDNPWFKVHQGRAGAHTRIGGQDYLNFSSYDYLGLNGHPKVTELAKHAIDQYGVSASGSRHVSGARPVHLELEQALAEHYGLDECVVFVGGYVTNVGVIGQLMGPKDLVVSDAMIHNSALTGAVLAGAARRSFPHNDLDALERLLAANRYRFERALIVVEGLYSMDGDHPDLARLIDIKRRYKAWLMVDEAHALGVLGASGRGSFEQCGIDARDVDIWMGTLSKTLAGCGGYIAGSQTLIHYLRCTTGAFVFSVAMPPVLAVAALTALTVLQREGDRVARLQRNAALFRDLARRHGLDVGPGPGTAVAPIMVGDSVAAVVASQRLFERGINVQPVIYPGVPEGTARLRFFLTAMHTPAELEMAVETVAEELQALPAVLQAMAATQI